MTVLGVKGRKATPKSRTSPGHGRVHFHAFLIGGPAIQEELVSSRIEKLAWVGMSRRHSVNTGVSSKVHLSTKLFTDITLVIIMSIICDRRETALGP